MREGVLVEYRDSTPFSEVEPKGDRTVSLGHEYNSYRPFCTRQLNISLHEHSKKITAAPILLGPGFSRCRTERTCFPSSVVRAMQCSWLFIRPVSPSSLLSNLASDSETAGLCCSNFADSRTFRHQLFLMAFLWFSLPHVPSFFRNEQAEFLVYNFD